MESPLTKIYRAVIGLLSDDALGFKSVDLDIGQFSKSEVAERLSYPAVLMQMDDVLWWEMGGGVQQGLVTLRLTIATRFEAEEDEFMDKKLREEALNHLEMIQTVHDNMNGFSTDSCSQMRRVSLYPYAQQMRKNMWIQTLVYQCNIQSDFMVADSSALVIDATAIRIQKEVIEQQWYQAQLQAVVR